MPDRLRRSFLPRCLLAVLCAMLVGAAVAKEGEFRLLEGQEKLTKYLFNTRKNEHYFCQVCGVRAFGIGTETPIGRMYGVNLGCLEGLSEEELAAVPVTYLDGLHDNWGTPPEFTSHM